MPTLITIGDSESERRCDAKCYDARGETCTCVCGGMNHGVGLRHAQENTRREAERLIAEACMLPEQQLTL